MPVAFHRIFILSEVSSLYSQVPPSNVHGLYISANVEASRVRSRRLSASLRYHQASLLAPRNVEALVLKGNLLLELKKTQEAVVHFREAMQLAAHRYEPVDGLVQCYDRLNRGKEAIALANNACKEMGYTARALTVSACR